MSQIEEIEISMEKSKSLVATMDAFKRLRKNKDFQDIIEDGYFKKESQRLVMLLSDSNMQGDQTQKELHDAIIGIGQLFQYFRTVTALGVQAHNSLIADSETHAELLVEGEEDA